MSTWYYLQNGQQIGPTSVEMIRQQLASGHLQPTDLVWREGMPEWLPAHQVPGLAGGGAPPQQQPYGYPPQQQYGQYPQQGAPLNYQAPMPQARPSTDDEMTGGDWAIAILCSGIGCILGIVWLAQGKKKGGKMLGISLLFVVIWNVVRFAISGGGRNL